MRAVNLIPVEARGGRRFGALENLNPVTTAVLGGLAAAVVLVAVLVFIGNTTNDRKAEAERIQAQAADVQRRADALAPDLQLIQARERSVAAVRTLAGTRYDWSRMLGLVSHAIPKSATLTSFTGTIGAGSGSASTPSTTTSTGQTAAGGVELQGCAASLGTIAKMMSRLRLVDGVEDVTFSTSTKSQGSGGCSLPRSFSINLALTGPAVLPTATPTAPTTPTGATS